MENLHWMLLNRAALFVKMSSVMVQLVLVEVQMKMEKQPWMP